MLDAPVLFLGVGLPGDRIHAPNERMVMDQFWKGLVAAGELLLELGGVEGAGRCPGQDRRCRVDRRDGASPDRPGRRAGGDRAAAARPGRRTATSADAHEWVSFEDPEEPRTWVFDVTFLLSGWQCIYGRGCQGVLTGPAEELVQGCCSYGAHFTDDDDVARVQAAAQTLTDDQWQFAATGRRGGVVRTTAGRGPGHPDGGRRLHLPQPPRVPGRAGLRPPPRRPRARRGAPRAQARRLLAAPATPGGHQRRRRAGSPRPITQWDRRHWGGGGEEFHWWCTEAPEAFRARQPVYVTLRPELIAMVGRGRLRTAWPPICRRATPPAPRSPTPSFGPHAHRPLVRRRSTRVRSGVAQARRGSGSEYSSSSSSSMARHHDA